MESIFTGAIAILIFALLCSVLALENHLRHKSRRFTPVIMDTHAGVHLICVWMQLKNAIENAKAWSKRTDQ